MVTVPPRRAGTQEEVGPPGGQGPGFLGAGEGGWAAVGTWGEWVAWASPGDSWPGPFHTHPLTSLCPGPQQS